MIDDLEQLVRVAVSEVFGTMLNLTVQPESPAMPLRNGEPQIATSVGFTGQVTGVVYVYSNTRFAQQLTSKLIGLTEGEAIGNEMVNDAMGELTNMVVGHLKRRLSDRGMACSLTVPSVVRGDHLKIQRVSSTEPASYLFRCSENQLVVEVFLKPENSQP